LGTGGFLVVALLEIASPEPAAKAIPLLKRNPFDPK